MLECIYRKRGWLIENVQKAGYKLNKYYGKVLPTFRCFKEMAERKIKFKKSQQK